MNSGSKNLTLLSKYICILVYINICGSVMLRNVIIALPEPETTGMQKNMISYFHSEMFTRCLAMH